MNTVRASWLVVLLLAVLARAQLLGAPQTTSSTSQSASTTESSSSTSSTSSSQSSSAAATTSSSSSPTPSSASSAAQQSSAPPTPIPAQNTAVSTSTNPNGLPVTVTITSSSSSALPSSPSQGPPPASSGSSSSSSLGTGSIIGISVAGGIAVIGIVAFIIWKLTRKRFSDFDDSKLRERRTYTSPINAFFQTKQSSGQSSIRMEMLIRIPFLFTPPVAQVSTPVLKYLYHASILPTTPRPTLPVELGLIRMLCLPCPISTQASLTVTIQAARPGTTTHTGDLFPER